MGEESVTTKGPSNFGSFHFLTAFRTKISVPGQIGGSSGVVELLFFLLDTWAERNYAACVSAHKYSNSSAFTISEELSVSILGLVGGTIKLIDRPVTS